MNNLKRKRYYEITEDTTSDDIFAILDAVESDNDDDIDNEMNDSDTEFVTIEEDICLHSDDTDDNNILMPSANIHTVTSDFVLPNCNNNDIDNNLVERGDISDVVIDTTSSTSEPGPSRRGAVAPKNNRKQKETAWKWCKKPKLSTKETCDLSADVLLDISEAPTPYEVFSKTVDLHKLIAEISVQTNIYAMQNGRQFVTDENEIRAFLGINYIMAINRLPTIEHYWSVDSFIGNAAIRDVMTRNRFKDILRNLHFSNNQTADLTDKANKVRQVMNHLNKAFAAAMSNSSRQSVDEHMVKFKGKSSMKQYIKSKPIKWGFKFWFRCDSKSGYLYEFDLYLGRKESTEYGLGESVVINLINSLKGTYCNLFFDNFFSSPLLVKTLFDNNIYSIGTVRANRKNMPKFIPDKAMKRGDCEFQSSHDVISCKWMDNKAVTLIGSCVEEIDTMGTVLRREKGASNKKTIPCPNIVKEYNQGMGGVDLCDQYTAAYRLDRRSKFRFYLRIFFDLMDVSMVNSFLVFDKVCPKQISLLDFKISVAQALIGSFRSRAREFPSTRPTKRRIQVTPNESPLHLPEFQQTRRRCAYCSIAGLENRTFVTCTTCDTPLCLLKDRNCFLLYHIHI